MMINHVRTLLLGMTAAEQPQNVSWEYIPETYHPVTLPVGARLLRNELFGPSADAHGKLARLNQLLLLLHGRETHAWTTSFDSRLTYLHRLAASPQLSATITTSGGWLRVGLLSDVSQNNQLLREWRAEQLSTTVRLRDDTGHVTEITVPPDGHTLPASDGVAILIDPPTSDEATVRVQQRPPLLPAISPPTQEQLNLFLRCGLPWSNAEEEQPIAVRARTAAMRLVAITEAVRQGTL